MFHRVKLYAYKFKREAVPQPSATFAEEFGRIVYENNLENLVGFQSYTNEGGFVGLEKTDFEARVSTTVDVQEEDPSLEGTAALHGHLSGSLNLCHNGDWTLKHQICLVRSCELSMEVLIVSMTHFVENDICGIFYSILNFRTWWFVQL
jgi:hypothetical protein